MGKRHRSQGHFCRVCGRVRANERFSGKGHARHICRDCELRIRAEWRTLQMFPRGVPNVPEKRQAMKTTDDYSEDDISAAMTAGPYSIVRAGQRLGVSPGDLGRRAADALEGLDPDAPE